MMAESVVELQLQLYYKLGYMKKDFPCTIHLSKNKTNQRNVLWHLRCLDVALKPQAAPFRHPNSFEWICTCFLAPAAWRLTSWLMDEGNIPHAHFFPQQKPFSKEMLMVSPAVPLALALLAGSARVLTAPLDAKLWAHCFSWFAVDGAARGIASNTARKQERKRQTHKKRHTFHSVFLLFCFFASSD